MPYIAARTLAQAVERLGHSKASVGFVDFLIVKRALVLADSDRLTLGVRSQPLKTATNELMATTPGREDEEPSDEGYPYINVFGTAQHSAGGYRSKKYLSNGTSVTVPRWRDVFDKLSTGPAVIRFVDGYQSALPDHLLTSRYAPCPSLVDSARWYYRFTDLEVAGFDVTGDLDSTLTGAFRRSLGLTDEEIGILFDGEDTSHRQRSLSEP